MAVAPSIGRADRVEGAPAPEADLTRALYEQYANQIFRYCLHQLGSREEAEDAVQSTFLNAFRGIKRGVVPELESAWLFKIAHNVCLSRRRTSWRRGRIESPTDFDVVEELTPAPSRRADELIGLQDVLEQMPDNQRRAILLREWQGLSYREIAEELDLSQAAVETLIFRARRALAAGLEQPPQPKRRIVRGADIGNALASLKSLLLGGGAAAKVAATVAVVSAGTVVAAAPVQQHRPPMHPPAPVSSAPRSGTTSAPGNGGVSVAGPSTAFPAKTAAHPRARSGLQLLTALPFGRVTGTTTSETVAVEALPEATAPAAGPGPAETPPAAAAPSSEQPAETHAEPQHGSLGSTPVPDKTSPDKNKTETSSGQGSSGGAGSSQQGAAVGAKGSGDAKATSDSKTNPDSKTSPDSKADDSRGSSDGQRKSSSVTGITTLRPAVSGSQTTTTTQSSTTQSTTTESAATSPPSSSQAAGSQQRSDSNGGDAEQSDSQKTAAWSPPPAASVLVPAVTVTLPAIAPPLVQTTTQTVPIPTGKGRDRWKAGENSQGSDH